MEQLRSRAEALMISPTSLIISQPYRYLAMSKLLEKELVKDFLSHRNAFPINCSLSAAFHKHLLQLPWAGFHLDWASLSHQSFNLAERPECQLEKWLLTSALRNDSFIAIV